MLVYIAGPYRAASPGLVNANIGRAMDAAVVVIELGHSVILPHTMTAPLERYDLADEVYLRMGLEQLVRCDAVCLVPGVDWRESRGTVAEVEKALEIGIPVYASPEALSGDAPMR